MEELLKELAKILQSVHDQTFFEMNTSKKIAYPYATYNFDSEAIRRNQDGFYLDIDIFDWHDTSARVALLEDKFKDALISRRDLTSSLSLVFSFQGSNKVPTNDEQLKRRNVRFYVAVDWRNKKYGIA
ncbi:hypothetical protein LH506_04190 [Lapidilactobacillus dextrinicus]|uniref:hypothetical protein n=1 Tax=Lapidilactobacillus dextrinicus TaxID=51664 RepID=UPI00070FE685|nr:hypothetical protein [Lapidilactobacillus dextrinicus]QFG46691.1 hypothetical protein LH506_04190 [Lapidilactobacillus dextrinicus]